MTRNNQSPQVDTSFVNNFWGKDDPGFPVLQTRMQHGNQTMDELVSFYHERLIIEKEYNKKLELLSKKHIGSYEIGTLKNSLDKFLYENNNMVNYNRKFIKNLSTTNYESLASFAKYYKAKKSKIEEKISHIRSRKAKATEELSHCKMKFQNDCGKLKSINLQNQTLLGRELEKNQAKAIKLKNLLFTARKEYELAIIKYKDIHEQYIRDWIVASKDLESLDKERIDFLKDNVCKYSNNIAILCVDNDQAVDNVRQSLALINPDQDLSNFTLNYGTGTKIYNAPSFINFLDGQDERDFGYYNANFENLIPEHNQYNHPAEFNQEFNQNQLRLPHDKSLPKFPDLEPDIREREKQRKHPSSNTNEIDDQDEIFSNPSRFRSSNNSTYSNPTSLSNYSNDSNGERTWSSPRKKYKELQKFQEEINLKSKETASHKSSTPKTIEKPMKKVPIIKDFSIDFIAKCLEDLNKGGDGDISQYRKSVRKNKTRSEPSTPFKTPMNFDDHQEIATQYQPNDLNGSPKRGRNRRQSMYDDEYDNPYRKPQEKQRPKSMVFENELNHDTIQNTNHNRRVSRSLSRGATKTTYKNLNRVLTNESELATPTGRPYLVKARALFSFKPVSRGELGFKKNAKMFVLNKQSDGWFKCELLKTGEIGLVPNNYIQEGDVF